MFINREQELTSLDQMWHSDAAEFFVLYGRRRVGKTELLTQFCKGKRSIYFLASQLKERDQLRQLTEAARYVIEDALLHSLICGMQMVACPGRRKRAQPSHRKFAESPRCMAAASPISTIFPQRLDRCSQTASGERGSLPH